MAPSSSNMNFVKCSTMLGSVAIIFIFFIMLSVYMTTPVYIVVVVNDTLNSTGITNSCCDQYNVIDYYYYLPSSSAGLLLLIALLLIMSGLFLLVHIYRRSVQASRQRREQEERVCHVSYEFPPPTPSANMKCPPYVPPPAYVETRNAEAQPWNKTIRIVHKGSRHPVYLVCALRISFCQVFTKLCMKNFFLSSFYKNK